MAQGQAQAGIKMPTTAYSFYKEFRTRNFAGPALGTGELRKQWVELSQEEKQPFEEMAANDRARYHQDMVAHGLRSPSPTAGKKRRAKAMKDPNAPKKPMTAFFLFSGDNRKMLKDANPGWGVPEIGKELGRLWGEMDNETKDSYKVKAAQAKLEYEEKMKIYKEQNHVEEADDGAPAPKMAKMSSFNA